MSEKQSDELFVGIREPLEIRRDILESSKEVIESLKKFQRLEGLKSEKQEEESNLRGIIRELNREFSKLRSLLPRAKLKSEIVKAILNPKKSDKEKQEPKNVLPKKEMSEIEKLEKELDEIDMKLSEIS